MAPGFTDLGIEGAAGGSAAPLLEHTCGDSLPPVLIEQVPRRVAVGTLIREIPEIGSSAGDVRANRGELSGPQCSITVRVDERSDAGSPP